MTYRKIDQTQSHFNRNKRKTTLLPDYKSLYLSSVYLSVHPYALLDKIAYEYAAHSQEFVRHFTKQYTLANMAHIWVFLPPHSLSLIFLLYLFLFVRKGEWEAFSKLRSEKSLTRCSKFRLCRASLVYDAEGYLSLVGCSAKE